MKLYILGLVLFSIFLFIPPVYATSYTTETWYMRNDTWTVNSQLGYKLYTKQSSNETYVEYSQTSLENLDVGIRIYRVTSSSQNEITGGTPVAVASQNGLTSGVLKNGTWTNNQTTSLTFDDSIKVTLNFKIGSGSWIVKATFISRNLQTNELNNSTWTVHYYITVTQEDSTYYYRVYFGSSSYNSRIENIEIADLNPWETMRYYLNNGDLVNFFVSPWTYHIGDLFYGIIVMFLAITSYNRYRSLRPIAVLFYIFGGTGGFLTVLIPSIGLEISFLFLGLAIAITLYLLVK